MGRKRWVAHLAERSWVGITLLGFLLLAIPFYDVWDGVSSVSWSVTTTAVENSVLLLLALALTYGGYWVGTREWASRYKLTVTRWSLGVAGVIAALYALIIGSQVWVLGRLKPWTLALNGVLFGAVVAFGVGVYNARQERMRADLEQRRGEYRTLTDDVLDTSDVATFVLDDEFDVVWINRATAEYFGLDREAVIGQDKRSLVETEIADRFEDPEAFRERVLSSYDDNTGVEEFECHILGDEDRDDRWLEHWSRPIENGRYAGGRIEHYTDITPIRRRERELEYRERKLRELYDVFADPSLTFDEQVDGLIAIGRDLLEADYGAFACLDSESGEHETDVVQSGDGDVEGIPLAQVCCEDAVREARTLQFETRPFDGESTQCGVDAGFETYVGTPVYEHDNLYGTLCFLDREEGASFDDWQLAMVELMGNWLGYELNRQHLLEAQQEALREQEAKLEEFVDTVDNYAIFTLDTEGHVTSWNQGAADIKGYTEAEIIGEDFRTFYPESLREDGVPDALLAEAAETGQASHEGWRVRKDGTKFWADVTIAARYDEAGEHVGYTKVVEDLTDQRAHERELEHQRERLEFMNRILRHNILNGLNLVGARTEILDRQFVDDPQAQTHLDTIDDRVADLSALIGTMRAFMDAIVADDDYERYPVALRAALDAKLELAENSYPGAVFETHDLPDSSTEVVADDLIGEIFENTLSNAVVHNDKATPRVEVWASETTREVAINPETGMPSTSSTPSSAETVREERDAVVVHIADNGPGIPDEEREAVLKKGVSEISEPGNGFGLYLVKEMMETYGGTVQIRDNDAVDGDEGTVFDLVFLRAD
ncbi:PAS domain S-box protein [Halarchaeum sp. P4]|uniref:PAS domain S-box protein n=1 Tax=Halarchaeum sp. P4 TaxID=3421639 RepID=UPI003EB81FE4